MDAALQVVKALLGTLQEPPATPFSVLVVCSIAGIFFQIRDISRSRFSMQISKWFGGLGRAPRARRVSAGPTVVERDAHAANP